MEQLVSVIQRLHEALGALGDASLRLPAVVAVGSQSSGKSSVLENIVGRDFLPRGTGIVTRRPVMMYLHNVPKSPASGEGEGASDRSEWVEFQHRAGFRYYNFDEVKLEIVKEMERVAGRNKGISADPICLTVHSWRVPDLVIIDLPGITKVPVGDQPADIELQIRRLCLHYMSQQNNIILAVHPANQDIANSDALKLALEADPEGERTIGVLTKIDLMDPGTDARDVLSGRVVALRRGFVPIVCRSQKDIAENMPIAVGLGREKSFFERHYAYRHMASKCGTAHLTRVLSHMLFTAIKAHLPALRSQLSLSAQSVEQQLREMGDPVEAAGPREQGHLLLKLLSRFAANFCDMIEGRVHADAGSDMLIDELFGGARMQEIVRTRFNQWTAEWETLMDSQLRDDEVLMALRNSAGPRSALFIPEQAFVSLVRRQIVQLKDLGRRFADEIYDELRRIAEKCEPPQLYRFGELREKAVEVVQNLLRRAFVPTVDMIDRLIDIELSHINTTHPDFLGAARAVEVVQAEDRNGAAAAAASDLGIVSGSGDGDGSSDAGSGDPGADAAEEAVRSPAPTRRAGAGRGGRGSDDSEDVAWAVRQLGADRQAQPAAQQGGGLFGFNFGGRGNAAAAARGGARSPSDEHARAGAGAASGGARRGLGFEPSNADDVRSRFGPRIVQEMLGDDGLFSALLGPGKRVGGLTSPYVEVPRPSPSKPGAALGAAAQPVFGAAAPARYAERERWATTPGTVMGGLGYASGTAASAGGSGGGIPPAYQGMALMVVPQKPLPELITPADLKPDSKERREIRIIRVLLNSYLSIVKKNYTDLVPKTVMCMLVNRVKDEIASELVHHLYAQITSVDALLRETEDVAMRRRELLEQLSMLHRALQILGDIRDTGIISAPPTAASMPTPAHLQVPPAYSAYAPLGSAAASSSARDAWGSGSLRDREYAPVSAASSPPQYVSAFSHSGSAGFYSGPMMMGSGSGSGMSYSPPGASSSSAAPSTMAAMPPEYSKPVSAPSRPASQPLPPSLGVPQLHGREAAVQ